MPGKPGLKGIAKRIGQAALIALAVVFSYTTLSAQSGGRVVFNTPVEQSKVANGLLTIKVKMTGSDIRNYTPENVVVTNNGRSESVAIKNVIVENNYMLVTLDLNGTGLMSTEGGNPVAPSNQPGGTSKFDIVGNLKEITIDNVSGVMSNDNNYNAIIVVEATSNDMTSSAGSVFATQGSNTSGGASGNSNTSRGDDNNIITKDEVQGFVNTYPNPATGSISLRTTNSKLEIKEVTLINAIGAKLATVRPEDAHLLKLDITAYPAGVYFMTIKTNYGDAVKRVVFVN